MLLPSSFEDTPTDQAPLWQCSCQAVLKTYLPTRHLSGDASAKQFWRHIYWPGTSLAMLPPSSFEDAPTDQAPLWRYSCQAVLKTYPTDQAPLWRCFCQAVLQTHLPTRHLSGNAPAKQFWRRTYRPGTSLAMLLPSRFEDAPTDQTPLWQCSCQAVFKTHLPTRHLSGNAPAKQVWRRTYRPGTSGDAPAKQFWRRTYQPGTSLAMLPPSNFEDLPTDQAPLWRCFCQAVLKMYLPTRHLSGDASAKQFWRRTLPTRHLSGDASAEQFWRRTYRPGTSLAMLLPSKFEDAPTDQAPLWQCSCQAVLKTHLPTRHLSGDAPAKQFCRRTYRPGTSLAMLLSSSFEDAPTNQAPLVV